MAKRKFDFDSMLNDKSKDEMLNNDYEIKYIKITDIHISENNFYKTDDIQDLKESIELVGLRQHIEIWNNDGKYEIISGHRRYKAFEELHKENKSEFETIPCRVVQGINKTEAEIQLIFGNSVSRELTDYEKMFQISRLEELLDEWQKDGVKIKGRKRDLIAEKLKMSKSQVGRLQGIEKNLSDDLKEQFKDGNINVTTAVELSKLDEEKQKENLEKIKQGAKVTAKTLADEQVNNNDEHIELENQVTFGYEEEKEEIKNVPNLGTTENQEMNTESRQEEVKKVKEIEQPKIERVYISDKDKQEVIQTLIKKYQGKLSVISSNIEKYKNIGREPNKNDLDEQLEYKVLIEALEYQYKVLDL